MSNFFLQYLPKKSTKFGIKVWVNAEAKTDYVLNFHSKYTLAVTLKKRVRFELSCGDGLNATLLI